MWVYHYNFRTKEYSGTTKARINPLETEKYGSFVYLCPANATLYPPPYVPNPEQYMITWDDEKNYWKVELKSAPPIETIPENDAETQTEPVLG
jgi:hypothetical protein